MKLILLSLLKFKFLILQANYKQKWDIRQAIKNVLLFMILSDTYMKSFKLQKIGIELF